MNDSIKKHAYLIIAHNQFEILEKLLTLLDDNRNDIFIHIDRKKQSFDVQRYKNLIKKSNVFFIPRRKVYWGHYSQIQCELDLLKEAIKNNYTYYHLLSGVDLPLKNQDKIHSFFQENSGKEFVHFETEEETEKILPRVQYFHLVKYVRTSNKFLKKIMNLVNILLRKFQDLIGFKRHRKEKIKFYYGSNWFSITNEFALYVVSKERWIKKIFRFTACTDEIFLQTLLFNSHFKNNIYLKKPQKITDGCLREIDWKRGNPYVYRETDFYDLVETTNLFARKFDIDVDKRIIDKIYSHIKM